jgi:hypothetical protein
MLFLFNNQFDLPLNALIWAILATHAPWILFSLYAGGSPYAAHTKRHNEL